MADIASGDVTYTLVRKDRVEGKTVCDLNIAFGDGALTYPAGGVPLLRAKMGVPNVLEHLSFHDQGSANGFIYKYDSANNKVRIYQGDNDEVADGPLVELGGSDTPAAATIKVRVVGW